MSTIQEIDDQCEATGVYRFHELGDEAKETARRNYRDSDGYLAWDWWDSTYDDFVRVAELLGLAINCEMDRHAIYFTLHDQGAGACYEGRYAYAPDAVKKITAYAPEDAELRRIAEQFTLAQTTARLLFGDTFIICIQACGVNTNSMRMAWQMGDGAADSNIDGASEYMDAIEKLLNDLAKWLYKQLEAEWDYLMSDECVDQYLEDLSFTDDGEEVT